MNILHLNTNYEVSSIYPNMFYEFNNIQNVSGRLYYPVSSNKVIEDINKDYVDISPCLNKFDRYFYFTRNKKLYKDVIKRYNTKQFDMTMAYSLFSNGYLAYTLKVKLGIPYIVIVQNTDINMYFKKMIHLRSIGRKILSGAHKVIFISEPYKKKLIDHYLKKYERKQVEKKCEVIPFGIDNFWFDNKADSSHSKDKDTLRLLYVGKINQNKNIITSAKACDLLIKQGYDVTFTIVGEVQDSKVYKELKKFNFIRYIPFLKKMDLINVYRANDIFIMPSIKESFGLVYAESMTQGLPIIYTRGQGFDKHFEEGIIGYSVNPTNINEIVNRIITIHKNYEEISENCLRLAEKFKWENIIEEYKLILNELSI